MPHTTYKIAYAERGGLSRATLTSSSRVMLVVYPVFALAVGLTYYLGEPARFATPQLDPVRGMLSLAHWGLMFLLIAAANTSALLLRSRTLLIVSLSAGFACYLCWALADLIGCRPTVTFAGWHSPSVHLLPATSLNPVWLWAFVAAAHIASLRSVTHDSGGGR